MASNGSGLNVPASSQAASLQAIVLALGQLLITAAFVGTTVALLLRGLAVDGQLWTLDVALVSFYLGQRVNLVRTTPPA